MSYMAYLETNTWNLGLIFIDICLFCLGMIIQHIFTSKDKLIVIICSSLVVLFCMLGGFYNSLYPPTRLAYVMGGISAGILLFESGAIVYSFICDRKRKSKDN